jgi:predicted nuclease of predicted toxin-antitoxin system
MISLYPLLKQLEFLLDEQVEGFDKKLLELGHKVHYAKKLREQEEKFRNDFNLVLHAQENNMIFVTKDKEPGQACKDNNIPCIWLSDERIFDEMLLPKLKDFE